MLTVAIISPERTLFEGTVDSMVVPAFDGQMGILPSHAPLMALLGKGLLTLGHSGSAGRFSVDGGFVQVLDNNVRVVTEHAAEAP